MTGVAQDKDVIYCHRSIADSFAATFEAQHIQDWDSKPEQGVIAFPFYCASNTINASSDNGQRPSISYNNQSIKGTLTGWGGNIIPMGERYFSVTDTASNSLSARTGNEKADGYQEGTINHFISTAMDVTVTAAISITYTIQIGSSDFFKFSNTSLFAVSGNLHIDDAPFGATTKVTKKVDFTESAKKQLPNAASVIVTIKSYNSDTPQNVTIVCNDKFSAASVSKVVNNQDGTLTVSAIITRQSLQSAWSITTPARAVNNVVTFEQGTTQTGQNVNIFESLKNIYGSSVNPFPNAAEYADVTNTTKIAPGPNSVPHSSNWNINGPYYPDSTESHKDVVIAMGSAATSVTNTAISFTAATSTASDGFENGQEYEEYDIDKVRLKLREPSSEPYESRTYIKISGSADINNFSYYSLSYKKSDGMDSYHQFKYSTITASGVLGYMPVKDKIGAYDVLITVVNKNNQAVQIVKQVEIGHAIGANSGGTATDAYEQAFLFFPAGALRQKKMITITPLKRDDVPTLADNLIPASLIYSFEAANMEASSAGHLRKDDFVSDSLGNIPKPAVLTLLYDTRQSAGMTRPRFRCINLMSTIPEIQPRSGSYRR